MEINQIKNSIKLIAQMALQGQQSVTPFIQGVPGIGKSDIIRQIKEELGFDEIIDLRMSQHDDTDIKGIPQRTNGTFEWIPPSFIPVIDNHKFEGKTGILFFDEINRATQEVLQSIFEVVHDYKVGGKPLHTGWFVVAAGNLGYEDGTEVTELDAALLNRFLTFRVTEDDISLKNWITHFADKNEVNPLIINFLQQEPRFLYYKKSNEGLITPRSWDKFSRILNFYPRDKAMDIISTLGPGIIYNAVSPFLKFVEETNKKPSIEDLLNMSEKQLKEYIKQNEREDMYRILIEFVEYVKHQNNFTDKNYKSFKAIFDSLDDDQMVAITQSTVITDSEGTKKMIPFFDKFFDLFEEEYSTEGSYDLTKLKSTDEIQDIREIYTKGSHLLELMCDNHK